MSAHIMTIETRPQEMNTYTTICEARDCRRFVTFRAESFDAAIAHIRQRGWSAGERDIHGYESFCPGHQPHQQQENQP